MATPELKLCTLQVNVGTGAWRTVMDFELQDAGDVMDLAENLFEWGYTKHPKGIRVRIMKPNDTAPLMTWCKNEGWQDWAKVPA